MKLEEVGFPLSLEAFMAYQTMGAGRQLQAAERGICRDWAPIINGCYLDGVKGDSGMMDERMDQMKQNLAQAAGNPTVTQIMKSMLRWMRRAWEQGCQDAEAEAKA